MKYILYTKLENKITVLPICYNAEDYYQILQNSDNIFICKCKIVLGWVTYKELRVSMASNNHQHTAEYSFFYNVIC